MGPKKKTNVGRSVADTYPGSSVFLTPGSGIWDPGWVKNRLNMEVDLHF
jgi:hypothetical protein